MPRNEEGVFELIRPEMYGNLSYPLTVQEGTVYVLGDNRNASTDSRMIGLIEIENILGKIEINK